MTAALSMLSVHDLGGLRVGKDRVVRRGLFCRNEGPASLEDVHHQDLAKLEIQLVCDLRGEIERIKAPNIWTTARRFDVDITNDLRAETNEGWAALGAVGARCAVR